MWLTGHGIKIVVMATTHHSESVLLKDLDKVLLSIDSN